MVSDKNYETTTFRAMKKDRLTDDERIEALWARQRPDRVPIFPFAGGFASLNVGYSINDIYTDYKKCIDAQRWTSDQYGWMPATMCIVGPLSASPVEEFGGEVTYPTGEYAQAPGVARRPVEKDEDILNLKVPDNLENIGSMPLTLKATAYQLQFGGIVVSPILATPMDAIGAVVGVEKTCKMMIKKPELVHKALRVLTDFRIAHAKLWADKFGAERLVPLVGGPTSSNQIISPKQFKEFVLPYTKKMHDKLREMGYKHMLIHICGEQNANMPFWAEINMGDPGIISVGHEIGLETVEKYFPNDIAFGNLEPAKIQTETPEQVYNASKEIILKGKTIPGGFIFSSGCEMPPMAPAYNLWMMTKAVNDFGWYE
ncbi:MAG: methylcobalamin:coenzyme M methyltransferase [Syntrophorhabdus sp. PtaU1.Bin058]|nr:MAG: methylcobalamin:coenzyme M methyltransferase [Syntrophorhabdus sp. PtaU1.Bin058]